MDNFLPTLPDWNNDDRMRAAFARFPEKTANKDLFERRFIFWRDLILAAAEKGALSENKTCISIEPSSFETKFKRKGAVPLGMATVLLEMKTRGDIKEWEQLIAQNGIMYSIASTSFSLLKNSIFGSDTTVAGDYVIMSLHKALQQKITDKLSELSTETTNYIFTLQELRPHFMDYSQRDLEYALRSLQKDKKIALSIEGDNHIQLVKIARDGILTAINEVDKNTIRLGGTCLNLQNQINELEAKVKESKQDAKLALQQNQKSKAKHFLKLSHTYANLLDKRYSSLHTIESIILKIKQAHGDTEIFAAYQSGTETLKSILETSGLTAEKAERVMDELEDAVADQNEISEILTRDSTVYSDNSNPEELEMELDLLMKEEEEKQKLQVEQKQMPQNQVESASDDDLLQQLENLTISNHKPDTKSKTEPESAAREMIAE